MRRATTQPLPLEKLEALAAWLAGNGLFATPDLQLRWDRPVPVVARADRVRIVESA